MRKLQKEMADTGTDGAVAQQTLDHIDSKISGTSTSQIFGVSELKQSDTKQFTS